MAQTNYIPLSSSHSFDHRTPFDAPSLSAVPWARDTQTNFLHPAYDHPQNHGASELFRRRTFLDTILLVGNFIWENAFLHLSATAFLIFCYVCAFKPIQLGRVSDEVPNLSTLKAGITTLSILYVSVTLLPLYSLISDLKSEEFFRALTIRKTGVPLASVNKVATPSNGIWNTIVALFHCHTSTYYIYALIATGIAVATSSLAPACLAVNQVEIDGEVVALQMGALQRSNMWIVSDTGPQLTLQAATKSVNLGPVSWAEYVLNASFSFRQPGIPVNDSQYLVPLPVDLPPTMKARWLSDIIAIRPSCEWLPTPQADVKLPSALNSLAPSQGIDSIKRYNSSLRVTLNITERDLLIQLPISSISLQSRNASNPISPNDHTLPFHVANIAPKWATSSNVFWSGLNGTSELDFGLNVFNLTTSDALSNGATVFQLRTCLMQCGAPSDVTVQNSGGITINVTFNNPEIKHTVYRGQDDAAVDVALLYCDPNSRIESRMVTNDGQGSLNLGPTVQTKQGNLDPLMTRQFLSYALAQIDTAGPPTPPSMKDLGYQLLVRLVFGDVPLNSTVYTPQSLKNITAGYSQLLQTAAKFFLDGSMSTSFVPARMTEDVLVLTASKPHLYASTGLYFALAIFITFCQFRKRVPHFSFYSVAASLRGSEVPDVFGQHKQLSGPMTPSQELESSRLVWDGEQIRLGD